jgi:ankyrin repeat protein
MLAARKGAENLVERLLAADADPRRVDDQGNSAADYAARNGHLEIVERLEAAGGATSITAEERQSASLLRSLKKRDAAAALAALESGADPCAVDRQQVAALTLAAEKGLVDIVQALLQGGADPNHVSERGLSPLRVSAIRGHQQVVQLLLAAGANPNARYDPGSVRADKRNTVFFSYDTVLHDAAAYGHLETAELLLAAGADLNATGADNLTPVLVAVNHRQMAIVEKLLAAGAVVRAKDKVWLSPFFFAKAAETPAFQQFSDEVAAASGAPAETVPNLPGVKAYRFRAQQREDPHAEPADAVEAGRRWGERFRAEMTELDGAVDTVLKQLAEKARAAGYLLLDAGMPLGCGPLTQYVVLLPTSDKFAAMVAFGVRGNDQELSTRDIVGWFRKLDKQEPFELRGVKFDVVDIEFRQLVADPDGLARRMVEFCHDLVGSEPEDVARLADHLRTERRVRFWWD